MIVNCIPHSCIDKKTIENAFKNNDHIYLYHFGICNECDENQLDKTANEIGDGKTLTLYRKYCAPNILTIKRIIRLLPISITRFYYYDDVDTVDFFENVDKILPIFKKRCPSINHIYLSFGNSGEQPILKQEHIYSAFNYYKGLDSLTISSRTRDNEDTHLLYYKAYIALFVRDDNFRVSPPNSLEFCEGFGPVEEINIISSHMISDENLGQYVIKCRDILKIVTVKLTKYDCFLDSLVDCSNLEIAQFDCSQAIMNPVNFQLFIKLTNLVNLHLLQLSSLSEDDLVQAFSCDGFKTIETLTLTHCQNVTDLVLLAISLAAKKLKEFSFFGIYGHTRITDYGVTKLLRFCNSLTTLSLVDIQGIEGYFSISIETTAPQLKFLSVDKCAIYRPIYKSNLKGFAKNLNIDIIGLD